MRSGTRTLHWDTPPPGATQRLHLSPKVGDSRHGILLAAHHPAGADHVMALDFNMQTVVLTFPGGSRRLVAIGAHWPKVGQNGYDRYKDKAGRVHKLTAAQKRLTIQQWVDHHGGTHHALQMLRRRNGDQFLTWEEAVRFASKHGVVLTPELKSRAFANRLLASEMVSTCKKYDYPLWSMALLSMKDAQGKAAAIIGAGGHFSLIFGRFTSQARGTNKIARWSVKPSQIWGPATAKRWIR